MAVAPFFDRVFGAVGGHLEVTRRSLEDTLAQVTVGIQVGEDPTASQKWVAELATNLLSRLYPRVAIMGPSALRSELIALARSINPDIEFLPDAPLELTITTGTSTQGSLHADCAGWLALFGEGVSLKRGPENPYAAGLAACVAASELFRRIFLRQPVCSAWSMSLMDYGRDYGHDLPLGKTTLEGVLYAGVGAVGNAGLWAMSRHTRLNGEIHLIDHETLDLSNLQRYTLGTVEDVGKFKVDIGNRVLANTALKVSAHRSTLEHFVDLNGASWPTICVSVDSISSRRAAQALLPRIVLNGWTGERSLGASWHSFLGSSACLACLYHPSGIGVSVTEQAASALGLSKERAALLWVTRQVLSPEDIRSAAATLRVPETALEPWKQKSLGDLYTDVVCGAAPLDLRGADQLEAVPLAHQSAAAGLLLAAELVKLAERGEVSELEPLASWDDVFKPPSMSWLKPRAKEPGCICSDPDYQAAYRAKWGLSEPTVESDPPVAPVR